MITNHDWEHEKAVGERAMRQAWLASRICLVVAYMSVVFLFAGLVILHWEYLV